MTAAAPNDPDRRKPFLLGVAIGVAALCMVVAAWYWRYTRTPEYSLKLAARALSRHDLQAFEKYVDIQSVADDLVEQAMTKAVEEKKVPRSQWDRTGDPFGQSVFELMRPSIVTANVTAIRRFVETGSLRSGTELGPIQLDEATKRYRGMTRVRRDGALAFVNVAMLRSVKSKQPPVQIQVRLRDRGNYWQVAAIKLPD